MRSRSLIPAAVLTVLATLTGCGSSPTGVLETTRGGAAVLLVIPNAARIEGGATLQLRLTARAEDGQQVTPSGVAWTASNPAVASVSTNGLVIGVRSGVSQITASWNGVLGAATVLVAPDNPPRCAVEGGKRDLALKQICVP